VQFIGSMVACGEERNLVGRLDLGDTALAMAALTSPIFLREPAPN